MRLVELARVIEAQRNLVGIELVTEAIQIQPRSQYKFGQLHRHVTSQQRTIMTERHRERSVAIQV